MSKQKDKPNLGRAALAVTERNRMDARVKRKMYSVKGVKAALAWWEELRRTPAVRPS